MAVIPTISVEHEHRWPRCCKLLKVSISRGSQHLYEPMTYLSRSLIRLYWPLADAENGPLQ
jgi:hypothetical protein